jgi:DNA-binding SARP family transcriptional activator/tetratricopeptide (TPR) repeat protein
MEFRLLGRVRAEHDGAVVELGRRRERLLLGLLLLEAGTVVPTDRLVELMWDGDAPVTARAGLRTHVSRLRGRLDPGDDGALGVRLLSRDGGYLVEVDPLSVDVHLFRARFDRGSAQSDPVDRSAALRAALALWHGRLLADVASDRLRDRVGAELEEKRLTALELAVDADLAAGRHAGVVGELTALTAEFPLRERFAAQLVLALHRCGRQPEALAAYQKLRERLVEELGIEPGQEIRDLYTAVLRHDVPVPAGVQHPGGHGRSGPAQLPSAVGQFTGRVDALKRLDALLDDRDSAATVVISAIAGTGGVGKTALAVHWAHQVADRFPDGQLYVNLRGYDPAEPVPAEVALEGFLRALGVDPSPIPTTVDDRSAAYRSLLAGRRVLVLLDNARSAEQVRPLLPGTVGCLVLVTSRSSLAGLVARDGAHRLLLDRLPAGEAIELLRRVLGPQRVDAELPAATELVRLCAGLPLALRIAAERAGRSPAPLADTVAELGDLTARLTALSPPDDPFTAVRGVLSWSYRALPPGPAHVFRILGLFPGPDLDGRAVAHLAGVPLDQARQRLAVLHDNHLVESHGGRYQMHDLLRAYAIDVATAEVDPGAARAALTRVFDYLLGTAARAMDLVVPHERERRPAVPAPCPPAPDFATTEAAHAWLDAERVNLIALAAHAPGHGLSTHTVQLSRVLWRYLDVGAHHRDAAALHTHALRAAQETGDRVVHAESLVNLGIGHGRNGRVDEAIESFRLALALARQAGDRVVERRAINNLGVTYWHRGDYDESLDLLGQGLALAREIGDRSGEANALDNLGAGYEQLKRYDEALHHLESALALARDTGNRAVEASALGNLGAVHEGLGRFPEAIEYHRQNLALTRELHARTMECQALNGLAEAQCLSGAATEAIAHHEQALALARELVEPREEARAHRGLGHAVRAAGGSRGAVRAHWQRALEVYTELGRPEADEVRSLLDGVDDPV